MLWKCLATIDSKSMNDNAYNLLPDDASYAWIGTKRNSEGKWLYADESDLTYQNFLEGIPGPDEDGDCVIMWGPPWGMGHKKSGWANSMSIV